MSKLTLRSYVTIFYEVTPFTVFNRVSSLTYTWTISIYRRNVRISNLRHTTEQQLSHSSLDKHCPLHVSIYWTFLTTSFWLNFLPILVVLWKWASFNTSFLNSCSTLVGSHVMFSIVLCCKKHLITFRESKDEFKLWILEHMTEHHQNLCTIPFSTSLGYKTEVKSQCYRWTRLHKTRKRF